MKQPRQIPSCVKRRIRQKSEPTFSELIATQHCLRNFEDGYDRAQNSLRNLLSIWTLAALGAYGTLLKTTFTDRMPTSAEEVLFFHFFVLIISLGLTLGSMMIWFLDQGVYQHLLQSVFIDGLLLETRHKKIPQIRTHMYRQNSSLKSKFSKFHVIPLMISVLINISTAPIIIYMKNNIDNIELHIILLSIGVILPIIAWTNIKKNSKELSLREFVGPDKQKSVYSPQDYRLLDSIIGDQKEIK